jgi:hypothetical protein
MDLHKRRRALLMCYKPRVRSRVRSEGSLEASAGVTSWFVGTVAGGVASQTWGKIGYVRPAGDKFIPSSGWRYA